MVGICIIHEISYKTRGFTVFKKIFSQGIDLRFQQVYYPTMSVGKSDISVKGEAKMLYRGYMCMNMCAMADSMCCMSDMMCFSDCTPGSNMRM